jgi:acyl-CoA thioesterase I
MKNAFVLSLIFVMAAGCRSDEPIAQPQPEARLETPAAGPSSVIPDTRPVILAFGDSLTAGYGVPRGSGYPERLQEILDKRRYLYRVVNAGVSGDTTSAGRARLQAGLEVKPSIVILELGANDGLRGLPVTEMRANLEEIIIGFQNAGATVVLASMTLPRNLGMDYIHSFESVFAELGKQYKIPVIPFLLEGVAGHQDLTLEDFLHPNTSGYEIVTENVLETLEPLLKK